MNKINIPDDELEILVSRSGGAGGQNVNKVNTKITLRFNYLNSQILTFDMKERFKAKYEGRISSDGFITIISQQFRTQKLNLDDAIKKLIDLIEAIRFPPKLRKKTKPTKASKVKRLNSKKLRGDIKKSRNLKF